MTWKSFSVSLPTDAICGAVAETCVCGLLPDHEPLPHHCQTGGCHGMWRGEYGSPDWKPVQYPMPSKSS